MFGVIFRDVIASLVFGACNTRRTALLCQRHKSNTSGDLDRCFTGAWLLRRAAEAACWHNLMALFRSNFEPTNFFCALCIYVMKTGIIVVVL